ncbi:MAG: M6 family metalloprotease domain-containing protein, partial [Fidelibacterota bacterium]
MTALNTIKNRRVSFCLFQFKGITFCLTFISLTFILISTLFLSSVYSTTSPKPGVSIPEHVKLFLKDVQKIYTEGDLVLLMRGYYREKLKKSMGLEPVEGFKDTLYFKFPVLVGKFSDSGDDQWPLSSLQTELFDGPWSTGTMREYYREVSYEQFDISGTVYGWYQAPQTEAYYENNANGLPGQGGRTPEFIRALIEAADDTVDFSVYDNDGNGKVETIFIVHYGLGGEYGTDDIWSHRSRLSYYPDQGGAFQTNDGVIIDDYIIQPALSSDRSSMIEIGVFCHEFGHALGLPDLYDMDGSSSGIGHWGLMASGNWNEPVSPAHMSAWSREQLGWVSPSQLQYNVLNMNVPAVEDTPVVYKLWKEGSVEPYSSRYGLGLNVGREYFLVENRQPFGFDKYLHGGGILIWHIDNSVVTQNDNEDHPLVDLEAADGKMTGRGDGGDPFPGDMDNRNFDLFTEPSSMTYEERNSQVAVLNISDSDTIMFADLEVFEPSAILFVDNLTVIDIMGNNNGTPEAGEVVDLIVDVENWGKSFTETVAILSTGDPDISIEKSNALFGDIVFEGMGNNLNDPFTFSVSDTSELHWGYFTIQFIGNSQQD